MRHEQTSMPMPIPTPMPTPMPIVTRIVCWLAATVLLGCGQAKPAPASAIAVEPAVDVEPGEVVAPRGPVDSAETSPVGDDASADTGRSGDGDGVGSSSGAGVGGLRVVAADGTLVGVLVSRGHPHQGASTAPAGNGGDVLRDGVLVYHPTARLFFGVGMASGKVISPRLGIAESDCLKPLVGGYYADGPEISGFDYAFVWKGNWWKVRGGEKLALVGCAGVGTGGETPQCVPHTGSCRGFPVDAISSSLPPSFMPPLHFDWQGVGG